MGESENSGDKCLNVVFFGPSGLEKDVGARNLIQLCERKFVSCKIQFLDIRNFLDVSTHLLLQYSSKKQQEVVGDAIKNGIAHKLQEANLNIISLHATHLCGGIPVFPCLTDAVEAIEPAIFFTLLDDVYACKSRLEKDGYPFRYSQLLAWRQMECGMVDHFAQVIKVENIYLAAKHPRVTVFTLIFEPRRPRVYSASQITKTRESDDLIEEIDAHRRLLHKEYVVFDPLTLDDRVLINNIPSDQQNKATFEVPQGRRWPWDLSDLGPDYQSLVPERESQFPLTIELQEALSLEKAAESSSGRNIIDAQIRYRDFRYIDQCDVMSAYRPYLKSHESTGVAAEKTYAAGSGGRVVVEYSPPEDRADFSSKPFRTPLPGPLCDTLGEFYTKLRKVAKEEAQRRYDRQATRYKRFETFRKTFAASC